MNLMDKLERADDTQRTLWKKYMEQNQDITLINYLKVKTELDELKQDMEDKLSQMRSDLEDMDKLIDDKDFEVMEKILLKASNRLDEWYF